jgi:transposase-like protein
MMEEYNKNDVVILEQVYDSIKPWIKGHANYSVFHGNLVCPTCGGSSHQRRGYAVSSAGKYARYQCKDCGTWFRSNKSEAEKDKFIGL